MIKKPNLFIVGAPKCGTTSMWHYLRNHPDIFMSDMKEPHYFCTDLSLRRPDRNYYSNYFADAKSEKYIGEASTWYLYSKNAAQEIRNFSPDAKIIIMLRNPVDLIYSLHSQFLHAGDEDIKDISTALFAEEDRKKGLRIPRSCRLPEGLFYREVVKLSGQIDRYYAIFEESQIHIVILDDLKKDPRATYTEVLNFLDLPAVDMPEFSVKNPNKTFKNARLMKHLFDPSNSLISLSKFFLPNRKLRRTVRKLIKRMNTKYTLRPPMDPVLRKELQAEFQPEVEKLGVLLARDLDHWSE